MKKIFYVGYSYGMGGLWAIFSALSAQEITKKYPMLVVQEHRPQWMTNEIFESIQANFSYDTDDEQREWLSNWLFEANNTRIK